MDAAMTSGLIALNNAFYARHAASFSATRQTAWQGWREVARLLSDGAASGALLDRTLHVFDLACGNLRFERFLAGELDGVRLLVDGVDDCTALARRFPLPDANIATCDELHLHESDVLARLLADEPMIPDEAGRGRTGRCDLSVCFGFMHHVPTVRLRRAVLADLVGRTRPGGLIAVSFWGFLDDARLRRKAATATATACAHPPFDAFHPEELEDGDRLLGWGEDPGPLRFCHHFDEFEIDALAREMRAHGASERARFSADGRGGALNRYLVLTRDGAANA